VSSSRAQRLAVGTLLVRTVLHMYIAAARTPVGGMPACRAGANMTAHGRTVRSAGRYIWTRTAARMERIAASAINLVSYLIWTYSQRLYEVKF
jgi:uncharacterized membrane protein YgdD (TMEM256/DUF423 family)